jgi:hypothetical protein
MMDGLLIESHFLPCIEYFCALTRHNTVVIEKHEHYLKQSFRNRCYILAAHGPERLTVPLTGKHGNSLITSVQIDYAYRWQTNFWRTLQSAYANSPYFEHYKDDLHRELFSGEKYLFDLNLRLLSMCLKWLSWKKDITQTPEYQPITHLADLRNVTSPSGLFFSLSPTNKYLAKHLYPTLQSLIWCFVSGLKPGALFRVQPGEVEQIKFLRRLNNIIRRTSVIGGKTPSCI